MGSMSRERMLAKTFVELADTLVDGGNMIELLDTVAARCVPLVDAAACGMLLADPDGHRLAHRHLADRAGLLEPFRRQNDEGPCLEAGHTHTAESHSHFSHGLRHRAPGRGA